MRVIQISDSQLSVWYECQLRYKYEKLDRYRLIAGKPDYLQEGSVIHKMMEIFYELGIPKEGETPVSYSDRIEAALDAGIKLASTDDSINLEGDRLQFLKDSFVQYADHWKNDGWIPRGTERYFTLELYREEDTAEKEGIQVLYEGIVDLLVEITGREGLFPVDHKTSKSFKTIKHASILSGQFIGYAVGMDTTEVVENKFGLQTSYKPPDRFIRHPISFDAHVLEEWKGWTVVQALKMDQAMQLGYFEPNYKACYRNCPYTSICYTRPNIREWKLTKDYIKVPPSGRKVYKANDPD